MSRRETPTPNVFGWDIQSIPWNLSRLTREVYREQRLAEYATLELRRMPLFYEGSDRRQGAELAESEGESPLYRFRYLNRSLPCTTAHFQLRHLVWSPLASSVLFSYGTSVVEWNPQSGEEVARANFRLLAGAYTRLTTLCATERLTLVGGFNGELLVLGREAGVLDHRGGAADRGPTTASRATVPSTTSPASTTLLMRLTRDDNGITNHIKVWPGQSDRFTVASNDAHVRLFDATAMDVTPLYAAATAVNATAMHPTGGLVCVASDQTAVELFDVRAGRPVQRRLAGHTGYTFSCDWSADGQWLVTGNEDHTARIWDLRGATQSAPGGAAKDGSSACTLHVLGSRMAAIRNVLFSPDHSNGTLAVMEETDFVTVYSSEGGRFARCTTIDFFGEASGVAYSPDANYLYVGCGEVERGGLLEFVRPRSSLLQSLERSFLY